MIEVQRKPDGSILVNATEREAAYVDFVIAADLSEALMSGHGIVFTTQRRRVALKALAELRERAARFIEAHGDTVVPAPTTRRATK